MNKVIFISLLVVITNSTHSACGNAYENAMDDVHSRVHNNSGTPVWVQTIAGGTSCPEYSSTVVDTKGNIYAVGYFHPGTCIFNNSVSVTNTTNKGMAILVKSNAAGTVLWARIITPTSSVARSSFNSVSIDKIGNIYVAGKIESSESYYFSSNIAVTGTSNTSNALLVKYNSSGIPQWALAVASEYPDNQYTYYTAVTTDSAGNIYVAGEVYGNTTFSFGNNVNIISPDTGGENAMVIKYSTNGEALWAHVDTNSVGRSYFTSVAVDSTDAVYICGSIFGTGTHSFDTNLSVNTSYFNGTAVLIKYDTNGTGLWTQINTSGNAPAYFYSVTTDPMDNVYTSGTIYGIQEYTFANDIVVTGSYDADNAVLVKYNSSGTAQWARSITTTAGISCFNSVSCDTSGNIYTTGGINGVGDFNFSSSTYITSQSSNSSAIIVKYSNEGDAQWARAISLLNNSSYFFTSSSDRNNNVFVSGYVNDINAYDFGDNVAITKYDNLMTTVLIKYY